MANLAALWGIEWLDWWQPLLMLIAIGLIVFLVLYRRRQM